MKVIIKRPHAALEVIEVSGLKEINQICGNLDDEGNPLNITGSDYRQGVFANIDMYVNGNALFNTKLPKNFWDVNGNSLYCGNVIFAGYNASASEYGLCALTDEQIKTVFERIHEKYDIC